MVSADPPQKCLEGPAFMATKPRFGGGARSDIGESGVKRITGAKWTTHPNSLARAAIEF